MFDISKTISSITRIIFQAITCRIPYQNCLFKNNTNNMNKKIDNSNSFCKTIFDFKANTTKRRESYLMKKIVIIELN